MLTFRIIAFITMIFGLCKLLGVTIADLTDWYIKKPKSIKDMVFEAEGIKKKSFITRQIDEITDIMRMTGREDKIPVIFIVSGICAMAGAIIASVLDNAYMVPVLGIGMIFVPIWYVKLTANHFKKDISEELETALSVISTAYVRNEDIVTAVEENISYLDTPIKDVFADFLVQLKLIDSDAEKAILNLKEKIENDVFKEWCDALIACQADRNLKNTLIPIISKLSDMRIVNSELELAVAEPRKEFIIMALLVIANVPLMYFLNKDWFSVLMFSVPGKIVLAIDMAAIFICTAFMVKITKPIEFRR